MLRNFVESFLSIPSVYRLFNFFIGNSTFLTRFVENVVHPKPEDRILDIGCGPGDILQQNKTRVGAYLRAPEINHDRAVESRPEGLFLAATISEHLISPRSGDFSQLYYMVTKIPDSFCSVPPHNVSILINNVFIVSPGPLQRLRKSDDPSPGWNAVHR